MKEKGREIWVKLGVILMVMGGTAALIIFGAFDGVTDNGVSYQKVGAVQAWIWACGAAVAGAGILVAGRSWLKAKTGNGNGTAPEPTRASSR